MAEEVAEAIRTKRHLVIKAGTGVGKSFAYLVPAILASAADEEGKPRKRVVISTHTISLQEQLTRKDIPFLRSVMPLEFTAVLVKGRRNYLSLRRLKNALSRAASVFSEPEEFDQLRRIEGWSRDTGDGSLADLDYRPLPQVWDEVASDQGNCMGRNCPTYKECFYYRARRRVGNAQILVVNHALFFSDLALRIQGASILPEYDVVVFDEAHTMESVAGDHLGLSVTSGQVEYLLNKLYNDRTNRGLLVHYQFTDAQRAVIDCRYRSDDFFAALQQWRATEGGSTGPRPAARGRPQPIERRAGESGLPDRRPVRTWTTPRSARTSLPPATASSPWPRRSTTGGRSGLPRRPTGSKSLPAATVAAPRWPRPTIDVGPALREHLFQEVATVIMTSATLATGGSFEFFKSRCRADAGQDPGPGQPLRLPAAGPVDPSAGHARPGRRRRGLPAGVDRDDPPLRGPQRRPGAGTVHQLRDDAPRVGGADALAGRAGPGALLSGRRFAPQPDDRAVQE